MKEQPPISRDIAYLSRRAWGALIGAGCCEIDRFRAYPAKSNHMRFASTLGLKPLLFIPNEPKGKWQRFKAKRFPRWALRRWPILYKRWCGTIIDYATIELDIACFGMLYDGSHVPPWREGFIYVLPHENRQRAIEEFIHDWENWRAWE